MSLLKWHPEDATVRTAAEGDKVAHVVSDGISPRLHDADVVGEAFAALPEMLAALELIAALDVSDDGDYTDVPDDLLDAIDAARAAIKNVPR